MPNAQTDKFFDRWREEGLMLTYGDVRLEPRCSAVLKDTSVISLASRFSRNVGLNIPIVSAAMDTVTEATMAIAMAKLGGIGTIHRGMTSEEQVKQVARVKHYMHGFIDAPITFSATDSVAQVKALRVEKGYEFESFPILDEQGNLVGLVTGNDFDVAESYDNLGRIMTPLSKLIVGKSGMGKEEAFRVMKHSKVKVVPLVSEDGRLAGMYSRKDLKRIRERSSSYNIDADGRLRVAAAVGVGPGEIEHALLLANKGCDVLIIDSAHGHTPEVANMIRRLKGEKIACDLVAGNISTAEAAVFLAAAGADGARVGQGPGSICTTRDVSGMGVPQGTAVYECAKALRGRDVPVCADGGVRSSGDIVIALALGASSVTVGNILAGTDEAPGDVFSHGGQQMKAYRGMGSLGAMRDRAASRDRYAQGNVSHDKLVPEGVEGVVSYKGPVEAVLNQYTGGLRTGLGYQGALNIRELQENACVRRMTPAGHAESQPHSLAMFKQAPNYPGNGR